MIYINHIQFPLLKTDTQKKKKKSLHAKPQGAWHVGLPVGAVEHEHAGEAAEEHPVWVGAKLHRYTGAQHYKHYIWYRTKDDEANKYYIFNWNKKNSVTYLWRESHNHGQTAPLEVNCYWYVLPASHQ